ncbi:MAG: hypothetical protein FJ399_10925, partial [Verrucomicrobia bacterium]|nr:hypothetical protein [Verrucomicrobiota bacterium]
MHPPCRRWLWSTDLLPALWLILCLGCLPSSAPAAGAAPKPFAIPAAAAEVTLETFSDQAGAQVIYLIDDVRGVVTRPVQGSLAVREALEQLVAGTGLGVVQDEKTGAFVVRRGRNGPPPAVATESRANTSSPAMKNTLRARLTAAFAAFTAAALSAQTVTPNPAASEPGRDDPVTMSPFQVSTSRDVGFVATASFAGGRMKTDLKDTPLAYSVLTKEFLDALAITDTEAAMEWAVNSYQQRGDASDKISNLDGGTRTRVRGVITKMLRNFFELGQPSDVYANDRVDFARGTNALLIGNGGLGGATILMTKQAMFDKRKGELAATISDQGARRMTLDFNQPIGTKVAMRGAFLWQDSDTWREVGNDKRRGVYLTAAARPWAKTQLRVDFEDYRSRERLAVNGLTDGVSGWDGITVVDAPIGTLPGGVNSNAVGLTRLGSSTAPLPIMLPGYNNATVYNFANHWQTMGGGATPQTPVNGILPANTANLRAFGQRINGFENAPARFGIATSKSKFFVTTPSYEFLPEMTTYERFLKNASFYVDQQIGNDIFVQVSYSMTKNGTVSNLLATRLTEVILDVNRLLPDGRANPYYLQPFVQTGGDDIGKGTNKWDELRAGIAYQKTNTRFGTFRFNVIGGMTERNTDNRTYQHVMARNPDIRQRPQNDRIGFRYYLLDSNRPYDVPNQITYVDPIANTNTPYNVQELLNLNFADANNRTAKRQFDYLQASAFAKLFKDRLTLLAGKRWDRFRVTTKNALHTNIRASYPVDWDGRTLLFDPDAPANYWSLSGTQRALYNPPILDQRVSTNTYGGIINATKWLGGFYNYAQTFDTSRSVLAINGNVLEPTVSLGWDAGIRVS